MSIRLIVDGYNLVGSSGAGALGKGEALEFAREDLLEELRRYKRMKGFRITVVFDGSGPAMGRAAPQPHKGIEVLFTRGSEKADDAIVRLASGSPAGVVVVTSDLEVARHCGRLGVAVMSSQEFRRRMDRAVMESFKGCQEEDEPDPRATTDKRGPSRKLKDGKRRDRRRLERL